MINRLKIKLLLPMLVVAALSPVNGLCSLFPLMYFYEPVEVAYMVIDMQGTNEQLAGNSVIWNKQREAVQYALDHNSFVVCVLQGITVRGQRSATACNENIINPRERNSPQYIEHIKSQPLDLADYPNIDDYHSAREKTPYPQSAFEDGLLHQELNRRGIKVIVIMGSYTHLCVSATLKDALALGYQVIFDQSLVTSVTPGSTLGSRASLFEQLNFDQVTQAATGGSNAANLTVVNQFCTPSRKQPLFQLKVVSDMGASFKMDSNPFH